MQVYNNAPAFSVWRSYVFNVAGMRKSMSRLSSGLKVENAGDDPAGLAISERFRAQYRGSAAAADNIENAIAFLQTADSWLQKVHDILGRMEELAVAYNDGTKSPTDLNNIVTEFNALGAEITAIAGMEYNTQLLFGAAITIQTGPDDGQQYTTAALTAPTAPTDPSNVATVQEAIDTVSGTRAALGADLNALRHRLEGVRAYEDNIRASESRIRDVDVARESSTFTKYQILSQVGTAMLAHANALPQNVLRLIS